MKRYHFKYRDGAASPIGEYMTETPAWRVWQNVTRQ